MKSMQTFRRYMRKHASAHGHALKHFTPGKQYAVAACVRCGEIGCVDLERDKPVVRGFDEPCTAVDRPFDAVEWELVTHMIRAFFVSAYADWREEFTVVFPRTEWMDEAPDEPDPAAVEAAYRLVQALEAKFGMELRVLYEANKQNDGKGDRGDPVSPEYWGHYCAMQAMGHGVGLSDCGIELDVPHYEFSYLELDETNYPTPKEA